MATGSGKRPTYAPHGRRFTTARRARFLDELEAGCNVTRAAAMAGVLRETAYRLRRTDPKFAADWATVLDAGAERLRAELLARALGTAGAATDQGEGDAGGAPMPAMDDATRIKVLQICRTAAGRIRRNLPTRTPEEALAGLIAKLERIEQDDGGD